MLSSGRCQLGASSFESSCEAAVGAEQPMKIEASAGCWAWDAVPTQASLTPLDQEEGLPWKVATESDLSPTATIEDLQSLAESGGRSDSETETLTGSRRPSSVSSPVSLASGPKFLSGLELSQMNYEKLSSGREWRRDLLLRGLPQQLCDTRTLEAFLVAKGMRELVKKVRVMPGKGLRPGSAVLSAASADAAAKLSKFFHGAQLPGARSPVAVGFAPGRSLNGNSRTEPMRVPSGGIAAGRGLPLGVPLPPGLECWTCPF